MGDNDILLPFEMVMEVQKILDKLYGLGYDRYSVSGNFMSSTCRLWKVDETECSITVTSSALLLALRDALAAAETKEEMKL